MTMFGGGPFDGVATMAGPPATQAANAQPGGGVSLAGGAGYSASAQGQGLMLIGAVLLIGVLYVSTRGIQGIRGR